MPPKSCAHALKFLLSSLQCPKLPSHCGRCLNGAFVECIISDSKVSDLATKVPRKAQPELWDAVVKFIFMERTVEQIQKLLVHLSQCRCSMGEARVLRYHRTGTQATLSTSEALFAEVPSPKESQEDQQITDVALIFILNVFCAMSAVVENSHMRTAARGTSSSWPINLTDLMPFGGDNLVETLLKWHRVVPETVIFRLMAHILRVCQMLVIPSLIKYRFIDRVVESTKKMVDVALAVEFSDKKTPSLSRLFERKFYSHSVDVMVYFKTSMCGVPYDCRAALFRGWETKAMQLCSLILHLDDFFNPPVLQEGFNPQEIADCGQELFRFYHMHMPPRPSMPVHPLVYLIDNKKFPPPASCRDPKPTAMTAIKYFRTDVRCSALGCPNTMQSAGKSFQRCGRCAVVSYCGQSCQTKAWKEENIPHKRVCPALRALIERGGGSALFFDNLRVGEPTPSASRIRSSAIIYRNWEQAGLSDEDLALVDDWYKTVTTSRTYPLPDGTEWTPGYDDYDSLITLLGSDSKCKKVVYDESDVKFDWSFQSAMYLNRLARWPSEVAKEEALLKIQPFWQEDIVGFWDDYRTERRTVT